MDVVGLERNNFFELHFPLLIAFLSNKHIKSKENILDLQRALLGVSIDGFEGFLGDGNYLIFMLFCVKI